MHQLQTGEYSLSVVAARVIIQPDVWTPENPSKALKKKRLKVESIKPVQSSLEDVFSLLAHRGSA